MFFVVFFFSKQKTAYELRIGDWSADVCSSDLYKRFLADVVLENGTEVVSHCANPGSMLGLAEPGAPVWLSQSDNPKRKLRYSWELVAVQGQAPEQDDGRSG